MKKIILITLCILAIGCTDKKKVSVALLPNNVDDQQVEMLEYELEAFYDVEVTVLPQLDNVPDFYRMKDSDGYDDYYNAGKMISRLHVMSHNLHTSYIIGVTDVPLKTSEIRPVSVAGLGELNGRSCVVSTSKMWGSDDWLAKASIHELGHCFGLRHCKSDDKKCIMKNSEGRISTLDKLDKHLCVCCMKKLRY